MKHNFVPQAPEAFSADPATQGCHQLATWLGCPSWTVSFTVTKQLRLPTTWLKELSVCYGLGLLSKTHGDLDPTVILFSREAQLGGFSGGGVQRPLACSAVF